MPDTAPQPPVPPANELLGNGCRMLVLSEPSNSNAYGPGVGPYAFQNDDESCREKLTAKR